MIPETNEYRKKVVSSPQVIQLAQLEVHGSMGETM